MTRTSDRIKVLHVITRLDKGGSAENTFLTVRHLDRTRYDAVLATGPAEEGDASVSEAAAISGNIRALTESGVRFIRLPKLVRNLRPIEDLLAFFSLVTLIRHERPVIVHTHTSKAGILGRWAAWICRVPLILHTPHGHVFFGYFGPVLTYLFVLLERWTARITDVVIALTPREKADHLRFRIAPEGKFTVIHSGVELDPFFAAGHCAAACREAPKPPTGTTVVATAGRLTAVKGQDTLIRAVADCIHQGWPILLLLLGDGERRAELEALAERLGITEHVRFLGWRPDVAPTLATCDLFCLPSLNEGMGKVLVEAMALGKPIVASDVGGIPDLVRSGENGLLVPPGVVTAWVSAILRLVSDPEERRRMGEAGRGIAPRYSCAEMIKRIDELYAGCLKGTHTTRTPETAP